MTTQKKKPTVKATYAGRILNGENDYLQRFLSDGKFRFFKGIKGVYIGYTYLIYKNQCPERPHQTDDEHVDNPQWEAQDELVSAMLEKKRVRAKVAARARLNSGKQVKAVMAALQPLLEGLNYLETAELVRHLASKAASEYLGSRKKKTK